LRKHHNKNIDINYKDTHDRYVTEYKKEEEEEEGV